MITSNSLLIHNTHIIGTSRVSIAFIVSLSINNTIYIHPFNGAQLNEPSWTFLPITPTLTQTMHVCQFRKTALAFYMHAIALL